MKREAASLHERVKGVWRSVGKGMKVFKLPKTKKSKTLNIVGETHRCKLFRSITSRKYIWVVH